MFSAGAVYEGESGCGSLDIARTTRRVHSTAHFGEFDAVRHAEFVANTIAMLWMPTCLVNGRRPREGGRKIAFMELRPRMVLVYGLWQRLFLDHRSGSLIMNV
jgi:hypothetical protein